MAVAQAEPIPHTQIAWMLPFKNGSDVILYPTALHGQDILTMRQNSFMWKITNKSYYSCDIFRDLADSTLACNTNPYMICDKNCTDQFPYQTVMLYLNRDRLKKKNEPFCETLRQVFLETKKEKNPTYLGFFRLVNNGEKCYMKCYEFAYLQMLDMSSCVCKNLKKICEQSEHCALTWEWDIIGLNRLGQKGTVLNISLFSLLYINVRNSSLCEFLQVGGLGDGLVTNSLLYLIALEAITLGFEFGDLLNWKRKMRIVEENDLLRFEMKIQGWKIKIFIMNINNVWTFNAQITKGDTSYTLPCAWECYNTRSDLIATSELWYLRSSDKTVSLDVDFIQDISDILPLKKSSLEDDYKEYVFSVLLFS